MCPIAYVYKYRSTIRVFIHKESILITTDGALFSIMKLHVLLHEQSRTRSNLFVMRLLFVTINGKSENECGLLKSM